MPNPQWLTIARAELGQHEIAGASNNPRIVEYHSVTTLHATTDEVAWCASFVGWCLQQAGVPHTHSAAAVSYATWGAASAVQPGAVVVLHQKSAAPDPLTGSTTGNHVGFWVGADATHVRLLGGTRAIR